LGLLLTLFSGMVRIPSFERAVEGERVPAFAEKHRFLNVQNLAQLAKDTCFIAIMAAAILGSFTAWFSKRRRPAPFSVTLRALLMASLFTSGTLSGGATGIIAHRGASADAPENTLASFRLGYAQQADADELDIHLTADGHIVVSHDYDTARTTGVARPVAAQTLEELRALEAGQWGQWKGSPFAEKIPLLAEVLTLVPADRRLFIEIKVGPEILPELDRVLRASSVSPHQLSIISFNLEVARAAKRLLPVREVCWLHGYDQDRETGRFPEIDDLIGRTAEAGLDGLDLHWKFPIDAAFAAKVHAAGLKLYTWTVDDVAVARAHRTAGVDGITTNRPGWLREQLALLP
jgi:glycerophosphoryl diester phosphodiesterase